MKLIYLFLSAVLYILSYAPFNYNASIFLSFIILLIVIENLTSKQKAGYLFYYAFMIHLIGVSWISESLFNYGSLDYLGSVLITFTFILLISFPYILVGLFHRPIAGNIIFNINLFASLFVIAEFIKSSLFGGFPWLLVGYSQPETIFNYIYPIFGSYAVSYIVIFISALIYIAYYSKSKVYFIFTIIFAFAYYLLPDHLINEVSNKNEKITFTIYQPNIYPKDSYNPEEHDNIQKKYIKFLNHERSNDIIVLPETIVPYELLKNDLLYKTINAKSNKDKTIITGLFTKEKNKIYNSMVFFSDNIEIYNKRKLVPFGEYTPWYNYLFELAEALNIPLSNLSHGSDDQKDIYFKDIKIIPVICFESTFSNLVNSDNTRELMINISNDSWFGDSLAPHQHLQISQIRAIEFNRFILRATNTGISAVINNNGKVIKYIPNNTEGTITGKIPIIESRSIYSQYGDIGILMLLFFTLITIVISGFYKKT